MNAARRQAHGPSRRIVIAGTGGQGVLTVARVLCDYFVERGHHVVSGQLHGMAQRGGAVQSCVIVDGGISPVIPSGRADFVVGLEPVETARALPLMSSRTVVVMNTAPVVPFVLAQRAVSKAEGAEYPDVLQLIACIRAVAPHTFSLDATSCAVQAGSAKTLNMVMLGCLLGFGFLPCAAEDFWNSVSKGIPSVLKKSNSKAFRRGVEAAGEFQVVGGAS